MSGVELHPHHGLCLLFFEGKGYSPAFIRGMETVVRQLTDAVSVRLTFGADAVCRLCPHRRGRGCDTLEKVRRFDAAVLAACRLHDGQVLPWGVLRDTVLREILRPGRLGAICGDCQWAEVCRSAAARLAGPVSPRPDAR